MATNKYTNNVAQNTSRKFIQKRDRIVKTRLGNMNVEVSSSLTKERKKHLPKN